MTRAHQAVPGVRHGRWLVVGYEPGPKGNTKGSITRVIPDCCGRVRGVTYQTLLDIIAGRKKTEHCQLCKRDHRREHGVKQVRRVHVAEEIKPIDPLVELSLHLWTRPVPAGIRRDVWGHPCLA